jgi:hypothetical protein
MYLYHHSNPSIFEVILPVIIRIFVGHSLFRLEDQCYHGSN